MKYIKLKHILNNYQKNLKYLCLEYVLLLDKPDELDEPETVEVLGERGVFFEFIVGGDKSGWEPTPLFLIINWFFLGGVDDDIVSD